LEPVRNISEEFKNFISKSYKKKDGTTIHALDTNEYYRWSCIIDHTISLPSPFTPENIFYMMKEYKSGVDDTVRLILPTTYKSRYEPLTIKIIFRLKLCSFASNHELPLKLEYSNLVLEDRLELGIRLDCIPNKCDNIRKILNQLTKDHRDSRIKSEKRTEEDKKIT